MKQENKYKNFPEKESQKTDDCDLLSYLINKKLILLKVFFTGGREN